MSATLAVNEKYGAKEAVTFVRLTFWDKLGEIVQKYLRKGSQIFVEGSLSITTSGEGDAKKYWTSVTVRNMTMLGSPRGRSTDDATQVSEADVAAAAGDDLPF